MYMYRYNLNLGTAAELNEQNVFKTIEPDHAHLYTHTHFYVLYRPSRFFYEARYHANHHTSAFTDFRTALY